jgi:rhodanese-related sulfurtransferase
MTASKTPLVSEVSPQTAWKILSDDKNARFVDVRTQAEWAYVGGPDISDLGHGVIHIEWAVFPEMTPNSAFVGSLIEKLDGHRPSQILFLCRSGVRSLKAAHAVADAQVALGWSAPCINVLEGFEGDLDAHKKRGSVNGWKVHGLPWRQT